MAAKGKLSFGIDEDEGNDSCTSKPPTPRDSTPADVSSEPETKVPKKKLGANTSVGLKPRVMTKTALQREAQQADLARQDFVVMRASVKATEVIIPFVFYDGTNTPGGRCRMKKGEQVWLFLDKARKVGAELGVGGERSRRDWARVSVDDLMLVRGEVILPHVSLDFCECRIQSDTRSSTTNFTTSCSTRSQASTVFCSITQHSQQKQRPSPAKQTQMRRRSHTILSIRLARTKTKIRIYPKISWRGSMTIPPSRRL